MEALKDENARLKKKIETSKGKEVDEFRHVGPKVTIHEAKEESEHNLTNCPKGVTKNFTAIRNS